MQIDLLGAGGIIGKPALAFDRSPHEMWAGGCLNWSSRCRFARPSMSLSRRAFIGVQRNCPAASGPARPRANPAKLAATYQMLLRASLCSCCSLATEARCRCILMALMPNISQSYRFARDKGAPSLPVSSAATDALSVISVWRALDGDRSLRVLVDSSPDYLVAELTFRSTDREAAGHDLDDLCKDHGLVREMLATT